MEAHRRKCVLRENFRLFRADRNVKGDFQDGRCSRKRRQLVKEWRTQEVRRRKQRDDRHDPSSSSPRSLQSNGGSIMAYINAFFRATFRSTSSSHSANSS